MRLDLFPIKSWTAKFKDQYENHAQVDSFLTDLIIGIDNVRKNVDRYESREKVEENQVKLKRQELAGVNDHLAFLNESLKTIRTPKLQHTYKQTMYEEKSRKIKLELWMENNNPNRENKQLLEYQFHKAELEYTTALATALCEWFATGAAGPGTLVFNEKTYTVS